jgi:enoyl-CoA hydratase
MRMTWQFGPLGVSVADHVAEVVLDNPPVNALNEAAYQGFIDAFRLIETLPGVRVVVLTAQGTRAFVAGTDVHDFASQHPDDPAWAVRHARLVRTAFEAIYTCPVPVIAAVAAPALGAGIGVVASCDLIVAAEEAVFGLPEIDVGVLGGARHLARLVPPQKVRKMMYTGERVPARRLYEWGTVEAVVPRDAVLETARDLARTIAAKSPVAIRLAKRGLNHLELADLSLFEGYAYEQTLTEQLAGHPHSREAQQAFFEKRPARFED